MKRIHNIKRTIALFLAMLMAATSTAFADWDSFQGNSDNNGTSAYGVTSQTPSTTTVNLPNNGASTGLDVEPLVYGSRVYAFHNGGKNGPVVTAVDATDGSVLWSKAVSSGVVESRDYIANVSQVSTPVLSADGKNLYGVYTYNIDRIYGAQTDFIPVIVGNRDDNRTKTASYTGINIPADYTNLQLDTGLSNPAYDPNNPGQILTGTATLTNRETKQEYTFSGDSYEGQNFSLYYSGYPYGPIPAGSYDLEITITNNTNLEVTWRRNRLYTTAWKMFGLSGIDGTDPAPISSIDLSGSGQSASPLTLVNNMVYFGIYDADRAYFQYNLNDNTSTKFVPGNGNSFYYAGAAVIGSNVVFGSENGTVYMRPIGNDFSNSEAGKERLLTNAGMIRSSVCYDTRTGSIYLTSYNGLLWKIPVTNSDFGSVTSVNIQVGNAANSSSTPVVSQSGIVYASVSGYNEKFEGVGAVVAVSVSDFTTANCIYRGDGVQCSPVVYWDGYFNTDYVYFTTNVANGAGYCCQCKYASFSASSLWSVTPDSGGNGYAVQGFSMGTYFDEELFKAVNFGVFGNDSNQLVIVK